MLVKNPDFTGFLIRRLFEAKGWAAPEALPDLPYEREARRVLKQGRLHRDGHTRRPQVAAQHRQIGVLPVQGHTVGVQVQYCQFHGRFPLNFTGNAMELLGMSVTDESGEAWPCLGLAEFTTVETDRRDPGDVIAHTSLWDTQSLSTQASSLSRSEKQVTA